MANALSTLTPDEWKYRGRNFNRTDIESIRRLIAANAADSRWAISRKLCVEWDWKQPNGALRDMVCRGLLLMLDRAHRDRTSPRTPPSADGTNTARAGDSG